MCCYHLQRDWYPACQPEVELAGAEFANIAIDAAVTDGQFVTSPAWPAHPAWLSQFGARDSMTVPQLLSTLYDELLQHRGDIPNFTSFLRVCCLRYRALQVDQRIPSDLRIPIRSLNAHAVLQGLRPNLVQGEVAHAG